MIGFGLRYDRGAGTLPAIRYLLKLTLWIAFTLAIIWLWAEGHITLSAVQDKKFPSNLTSLVLPLIGSGGAVASVWAIVIIVRQMVRTFGNPIRSDINKYFRKVDYATQIDFIEQFHVDLEKILAAYAGGEKIFVFIDDLDRCEVSHAADLMGAINLLIDEGNKIVFMLSLDREKVAAGLAVKFKSVIPYIKRFDGETHGVMHETDDKRQLRRAGVEYGYEFIEKFIKLPIRVPVPEPKELNKFLSSLNVDESTGERKYKKNLLAQVRHTMKRILNRLSQKPSPLPADSPKGLPSEESGTEDQSQLDWNRFELSDDRDSEDVRDIAEMVAPALEYNPRRIIHFMNNFRLRAYTAYRTGLFNPGKGGDILPLRLEQLGKFVAIALRWPLFIYELAENPAMLSQLASFAEGKAPSEKNFQLRWEQCGPLIDLLKYGIKEDYDRFTMSLLNVEKLPRVSPAVDPKPAEVSSGGVSPDVIREAGEQKLTTAKDYHKAGLRYFSAEDFREAERHYRMAAERDPQDAEIAKDLGDLLKTTGRGEEAITEYIRAREIDPDDFDPYYRRGLLYEEIGVPEKALVMYKQALERGAGEELSKKIEELEGQIHGETVTKQETIPNSENSNLDK